MYRLGYSRSMYVYQFLPPPPPVRVPHTKESAIEDLGLTPALKYGTFSLDPCFMLGCYEGSWG